MITVHIIIANEDQGRVISNWLLTEKLAFDSVDIDHQESFTLAAGVLVKTASWKLQLRTKALLYTQIEEGLKEQFATPVPPFIYSTPIVQMDQEMARRLRESTLKA
jgi:uncharacterized protein involved in tolerance to divalent cations